MLIGVLLGATASETGLGITALVAIGLLVFVLVTAVARPLWYQDLLLRFGVVRSARPNDVVAAGIGRTFQNIRLFQNMTVLENVLVGMHLQLRANLLDHIISSRRQRREEEAAHGRGHGSCSGSSAFAGARTSWPRTCPTATSAGSRWPARSATTRRSCCSTSRRPA